MQVCLKHNEGNIFAGPGCKTRINVLVGANNPSDITNEIEKINCLANSEHRPDIITDLSLYKSSNPVWKFIIKNTTCVAATVPVYSARINKNKIDDLELIDLITKQAEEGVGLLTIHPTATHDLIDLSRCRMMPWTSRGGNLIIRDLLSSKPTCDNAYIRILDKIITIAKANSVVISLGATFRSANIFDSCDATQLVEIGSQIKIANYLRSEGVEVIIESPGHARPSDIRKISRILRKSNYPIMPLGPIPTDIGVGSDHITAAIGATLLGVGKCAHILSVVTKVEHTGGIPNLNNIIEAVEATRIAAHIIDLNNNIDIDKDYEISLERSSKLTCVVGYNANDCTRCGDICPLVT